ncbi:MAG: ABC transporter permease, partial [Planctomycetales bacterium]
MPAWDIALKDLRLQFRDRRALTVLLALPIVFIAIIGLTTGQLLQSGEKSRKYKIAVVDADQSLLSGKVIDLLRHKKGLSVERRAPADAERLLADESADAVLYIGDTFQARVARLVPHDLFDTERGELFSGPKGDTAASLAKLDLSLQSRASFESTVANMENQLFAAAVQVITPYVLCRNRWAERIMGRQRCAEYRLPEPGEELAPEPDPMFDDAAETAEAAPPFDEDPATAAEARPPSGGQADSSAPVAETT